MGFDIINDDDFLIFRDGLQLLGLETWAFLYPRLKVLSKSWTLSYYEIAQEN